MSEEKIKIKAERLLFFLVRHNFYMSEDSLTVKYSESGLKKRNMTCTVSCIHEGLYLSILP